MRKWNLSLIQSQAQSSKSMTISSQAGARVGVSSLKVTQSLLRGAHSYALAAVAGLLLVLGCSAVALAQATPPTAAPVPGVPLTAWFDRYFWWWIIAGVVSLACLIWYFAKLRQNSGS